MTALSATSEVVANGRRELPPSMVERMTLILDAFDGFSSRLALEDVARRTHLPRSTVHRILDQLVRLRWLERTSIGYGLGQRALGFSEREGSHAEIRAVAAPLLHELAMKTGMIVHLAVLDDAEVYYLDKVGGRFASVVPSRVGGRAPAHSTALGKAMLAWMEPERVDSRIGQAIGRITTSTISDLTTLHQELDRIRRRHGLAFECGECFLDISCVAAAIRGPQGPLASISLVGNGRAPLEKVAPLVIDSVRKASQDLFPNFRPARRQRDVTVAAGQSWSAETMDRFVATGARGSWL